jgi:hypothetical protein
LRHLQPRVYIHTKYKYFIKYIHTRGNTYLRCMYTVRCTTEIIKSKVYTHLKHLLLSKTDKILPVSSVYTYKVQVLYSYIHTRNHKYLRCIRFINESMPKHTNKNKTYTSETPRCFYKQRLRVYDFHIS